MKGFLVAVIIIAIAGGVAWQQGLVAVGASPAASPSAGSLPTPPPAIGGAVGGNASLSATSAPASAVGLGKTVEQAAARYNELVAAGEHTSNAEIVGLARVFSAALQSSYGLPDERSQPAQAALLQYLQPIANVIFFTSTPLDSDSTGFVTRHVFQSGESLGNVGRRYGMSVEFINMLRGRSPGDGLIHAGTALKVFNVKESGYTVHVDKSSYYADLYVGDIFAKRFPIGHGAVGSETPVGTSHINNRSPEPSWTPPGSSVMLPYGHPDHVIGRYWLGIDPSIGKPGLGFHGYTGNGPATGGMYSNGCIRLEDNDMAMLYNILVPCMRDSSGQFITRAPMKVVIAR